MLSYFKSQVHVLTPRKIRLNSDKINKRLDKQKKIGITADKEKVSCNAGYTWQWIVISVNIEGDPRAISPRA